MRGITSGCVSVGQLAFPSSECQLALELIKYSSFPPFPLLPLAFAVCLCDLSVLLWPQRDNMEPLESQHHSIYLSCLSLFPT